MYRGECMDKFSTALRGYDKNEVNTFIDNIIAQVETMVKEIELKDKEIVDLKQTVKDHKLLIRKMNVKIKKQAAELESLSQKEDFSKEFDKTVDNLERAKIDAKKILDDARSKANRIIDEANSNADIIINECLMNAKKSEMTYNNLKREIENLKQMKETLYYDN